MDLIKMWLAGIAPLALIFGICLFGRLVDFIVEKLNLPKSRFDSRTLK